MILVDAIVTSLDSKTAMPPPRLNVLDEDAAQFTAAEEFENELEEMLTAADGTKQNTAPPAALLVPEAHDTEEVTAMQSLNVEFA